MNIEHLCLSCMADKGDQEFCPRCGWSSKSYVPGSSSFLVPGTIINSRYLVGLVIGCAGFGVTYIGWDMLLRMKVAIKEYAPYGLAFRKQNEPTLSVCLGEKEKLFKIGLQKFFEEASLLSRIEEYPGLVSVINYFTANNTAYIVMDYAEGMSIDRYANNFGGRISFDKALTILFPVMNGLQVVHNNGMIHGDIYPDNIHITINEQAKLLNFGNAKLKAREIIKDLPLVLKKGYAAEEQYRENGVQGPWTDVYAIAATIYKLITGLVPPDSRDRAINDTICIPSEMGINITPTQENALMKGLAVYAKDRFQTIDEFLQEFASIKALNNQQHLKPFESLQARPPKQKNEKSPLKKSNLPSILLAISLIGLGIFIIFGGIEYLNYSVKPYSNTIGIFTLLLGLMRLLKHSNTPKLSKLKLILGLIFSAVSIIFFYLYDFIFKEQMLLGLPLSILLIIGIYLIMQYPKNIFHSKLCGAIIIIVGFAILILFDKVCPLYMHSIGAAAGLLVIAVGFSTLISASNKKKQFKISNELPAILGILLVSIGIVYAWNIYFAQERYIYSCKGTSIRYNDSYYYTIRGKGLFKDVYYEKICSDNVKLFTIANNNIYYANGSDGGKLYKTNIDGSLKTKINDDKPNSIFIYNNTLYYTTLNNSGKLFSLLPSGEKNTLVSGYSYIVNILDNQIYYIAQDNTGSRLYKININGTDCEKLCSDIMEYIFLDNNFIYYSNKSDNDCIYMLSTDGSIRRRLTVESARISDVLYENTLLIKRYSSFFDNSEELKPGFEYEIPYVN